MNALLLVTAVFLVAGSVKGTVGMGLPLIAMGLLVLIFSPAEAAAVTLLPAFVTNVWQMASGGHLLALLKRLKWYLLCLIAFTLMGRGWLPDNAGGLGSSAVGIVLALYAMLGLAAVRPRVPEKAEGWLKPAVGAITGAVTAATGIFSVPSAPFLQALGLPRDHLVQALGLSFTLSSVALACTMGLDGRLSWNQGPAAILATVAALAGMRLGRAVRHRLPHEHFATLFLWGLLILGAYLAVKPLLFAL